MRIGPLSIVLAFLVVGCSKTEQSEQSKTDQPSQPAVVAADNSGRN